MTPLGVAPVGRVALGVGGPAPSSATGSLLEVSAGDLLRLAASLAVLAVLWWPFVVAAVVGAWRVFEKAGRPGWACLVPGYNAVEFLRVAKLPRWLAVVLLVPGVNIVLFAIACVRVASAFRKSRRFAAGLVLLPPVYMANLGLSSARYRRFELLEGERGEKPDAAPRDPAASSGAAPPGRESGPARDADRRRGVFRVVEGRRSQAADDADATHTLDIG